MTQQTVNSIPKVTVGEGALGTVLFVSALANPAAAAVPAFLLISGGVCCLVRRSEAFQQWTEDRLAASEEHDETFLRSLYEGALKRAPLPPPGVRLALPAPASGNASDRAELELKQDLEARISGGGIGQALMSVFGDDNPLDKARSRAGSSKNRTRPEQPAPVQPGRPRNEGATREIRQREGSVTRQLQVVEAAPAADDPDAEWLHKHAGGTKKAPVKVMPIRQLCELLNDDENVDDKPHLIVFGDTGSGKTTLAQLIVGTRPGKVVILDPKRPRGWKGAKWGGLPYVCPDKDGNYTPLVRAMAAIVREMDARYAALETMTEPPEQLTVVLDEAPDCVAASPELAALYKKVVRKGREAFVRLILISTTDRVGPLGFEGQGDLMNSLADVRLGQFAVDVRADSVELGENKYEWAVYAQGGWKPFDNSRTLELTEKLNLKPSKAWTGIQYNCQVPATTTPKATVERPAAPQQQPASRPAMAAQVEAPVRLEMDTELLDRLMQIAPNTVKRKLAEGGLEGGPEGFNGSSEVSVSGRSIEAPSNDTSADLPLTPQGALETIKGASPDEKRKLGRSWKLFTENGGKKGEAILRGFELKDYGRGYTRGKELFDAWRLLVEKGLVKR